MKTLVVIRHAESDRSNPTLLDCVRPLSRKGKQEAQSIAQRLRSNSLMPSEILSSTAIRALETARLILEQLNLPITALTACEEIYGHGPQGLIVATKKLKPETKIACLVGHNPDVTDFAGMLTGIPINDMPTSGILAVEFDLLHWPKSMEATGRPIHFSGP